MNAMTETYEDVKQAIRSTAKGMAYGLGGDADEMESEGNVAFVRAYAAFDPRRGSFSQYLKAKMRFSILSRVAKDRERAEHHGAMPPQVPQRKKFDLERILLEVSEDAKKILGLVLEDVEKPANYYRRKLVPMLEAAGWLTSRIERAFDEIREVIHDPEYSSA